MVNRTIIHATKRDGLGPWNGTQTVKRSVMATFPWSLSTTLEAMHVDVIRCKTSLDMDAWRGGKVESPSPIFRKTLTLTILTG